MDDAQFWRLIERLDWSREGDDDAVIRPLVDALATLPPAEIIGFERILAASLYALDGRAWAGESGDLVWWGEPDSLSVDAFLYARCCVVANGRAFYEQVRANPSAMPKDFEFEALLEVASSAWERATGTQPSDELEAEATRMETFSNAAGWPTEGGTT